MPDNNQIAAHEVPRYTEQSGGWTLMELGGELPDLTKDIPKAKLIFIRFQRPYFIFQVAFLVQDGFVEKCIYDSLRVDLALADGKFYWLNCLSDETCAFHELVTSKIGPEMVTLSDQFRSHSRRPRYLEDQE